MSTQQHSNASSISRNQLIVETKPAGNTIYKAIETHNYGYFMYVMENAKDLPPYSDILFELVKDDQNFSLLNYFLSVQGVDIQSQDKYGKNILAASIWHNASAIAKNLIKNYPDLINSECNIHPPLHIAIIKCNYDMVKALIAAGANCNLKDIKGETTLDCINAVKSNASSKILKQIEKLIKETISTYTTTDSAAKDHTIVDIENSTIETKTSIFHKLCTLAKNSTSCPPHTEEETLPLLPNTEEETPLLAQYTTYPAENQ